jgi:hypothetical protein
MLDAVKAWAVRLVVTRVLQPSSVAGYALAIWTYMQWQPDAAGTALLQQIITAFVAFLLFLINERPWTKTLIEAPK